MRTISRDDGFTLTELLMSTTITLMLLGAAMTTVKNALMINDTGTQIADSNQNLRAGTNLLVRDLLQAGRLITIGGIPIPSGAGATAINRPSPPGFAYTFDNTNATTLPAITTGAGLGPTINNATTDMVTILMIDPFLPFESLPPGSLMSTGDQMTLGGSSVWLTGDAANSLSPVKPGDLVWFNSGGGAIQTVTKVTVPQVFFEASNTNDWFNFNQPGAAQGSITQLKVGPQFPAMKVYRLIMLTYYVDATTVPGTPRLTRIQNHFSPQALAGVVEDLDIDYDLVDGVNNPTRVASLPVTLSGLTYTSNQIRKANLHIGVRSDVLSALRGDYIRFHASTSVSIRDLASVNRYQ